MRNDEVSDTRGDAIKCIADNKKIHETRRMKS